MRFLVIFTLVLSVNQSSALARDVIGDIGAAAQGLVDTNHPKPSDQSGRLSSPGLVPWNDRRDSYVGDPTHYYDRFSTGTSHVAQPRQIDREQALPKLLKWPLPT